LSVFSEGKCLETVEKMNGKVTINIKTGSNSYNTGRELFDYIVDIAKSDGLASYDEISFLKAFATSKHKYADSLEVVECSYKVALVYGLSNSDVHHDVGVLYVATGRDDFAAEEFLKALAFEPNNTHFLYDIATLHYKNGMHKKAAPYFQELKKLMPNDIYVQNLADQNILMIK
jgi:tetratricopeptide (TPR) repeat protein